MNCQTCLLRRLVQAYVFLKNIQNLVDAEVLKKEVIKWRALTCQKSNLSYILLFFLLVAIASGHVEVQVVVVVARVVDGTVFVEHFYDLIAQSHGKIIGRS